MTMRNTWTPYAEGKTINQEGTEGGRIIRDDEHIDGARITLEQGCRMAPFAITCGIYGWMVHSCFYADQMTAEDEYALIKEEIEHILTMIPRDDAPDLDYHLDSVEEAVASFARRFS